MNTRALRRTGLIDGALTTSALVLAGCAGRPASLDQAQTAVNQALADPQQLAEALKAALA